MDGESTLLTNGPVGAAEITPSDANDLVKIYHCVFQETLGDLKVTFVNGDVVTFPGLQGGVWHPMQIKKVWETGTNATTVIVGSLDG